MSANSKIEWTDHTFNPWIGCTKVSPACDHCYAEVSTPSRTLGVAWGPKAERRRTSPGNWAMPRRWNAQAEAFQAKHGRRQRVFCASLADVFDNEVPDAWRADLFELIAATPNLDWLLLTKRISNAHRMIDLTMDAIDRSQALGATEVVRRPWPWPNVWIGATICNQEEADRDIPKLLAVPARVRFLSMEPLLGQVDLRDWFSYPTCAEGFVQGANMEQGYCERCGGHATDPIHTQALHWVIVGGESGPYARPMHPDWARSLRDQCQAAGVPFHFKQWGEHSPGELQSHPNFPGDQTTAWRLDQTGQRWNDPLESVKPRSEWKPVKFIKPGKKIAGRMLDGRTWDEVPA